MAAACLALHRYNKALAACRKALELDPTFVKAHLRAARAYAMQGKWLDAKRQLDRVALVEPSNPDAAATADILQRAQALLARGRERLDAGRSAEAEMCADEVLRDLADRAAPAAALKGDVLLLRDDFDEAAKLAGDFLRDDDQNGPLLVIRARALAETGQLDQAMKHFQKALSLDPDNPKLQKMFKSVRAVERAKAEGNELYAKHRFTEALASYSLALGKIDEAAELFKTLDKAQSARALRQNRAPLHANAAACELELSRWDDAARNCTKALELSPDYVKALLRRAKAHMQLSKYQDAVYDYEAAQKLQASADTQRLLREAKAALKQSLRKDYYKILGVTRGASDADIKKGYRLAALKHHPDKAAAADRAAAEQMFKDVGEAYGVLGDADKRRKYDSGQDLEEIEQGGGGGHGHGHGFDPNDIFAQMFGGGGGGGGARGFGGGGFHRGGSGGRRGHPAGFDF
jgi:DnaJ family protein C protein 7